MRTTQSGQIPRAVLATRSALTRLSWSISTATSSPVRKAKFSEAILGCASNLAIPRWPSGRLFQFLMAGILPDIGIGMYPFAQAVSAQSPKGPRESVRDGLVTTATAGGIRLRNAGVLPFAQPCIDLRLAPTDATQSNPNPTRKVTSIFEAANLRATDRDQLPKLRKEQIRSRSPGPFAPPWPTMARRGFALMSRRCAKSYLCIRCLFKLAARSRIFGSFFHRTAVLWSTPTIDASFRVLMPGFFAISTAARDF